MNIYDKKREGFTFPDVTHGNYYSIATQDGQKWIANVAVDDHVNLLRAHEMHPGCRVTYVEV